MNIKDFFKRKAERIKITTNDLYQALYKLFSYNLPVINDKLTDYVEKAYNVNAWVGAIIDMIAVEAASVNVGLFKYDSKGEKERVLKHDLLNLKDNPNSQFTWNEFIELAVKFDLITGNNFFYAPRVEEGNNRGRIAKDGDGNYNLNIMPAHQIKIISGDVINPIKAYELNRKSFDPFDVLHIRRANTGFGDGKELYGESPMKSLRTTISTSNSAQTAQHKSFQNGGMSGILSFKEGLSPEQLSAVKGKLRKDTQGPEHQNKIHVTGAASPDYLNLGRTTVEMGILESELQSMRKICANYQVSSGLFNDPVGSTYNNKQEERKALYTDAVLPVINRILTALNNWAVSSYNTQGITYKYEALIEEIPELQQDKKELWTWLSMPSVPLTPNQKLRIAGLEESKDPGMDIVYMPMNLVPMGFDDSMAGNDKI